MVLEDMICQGCGDYVVVQVHTDEWRARRCWDCLNAVAEDDESPE